MADLLDRVFSTLAELVPELGPERLKAAEVRLREVEGGTDGGYIARRPAERRAWQIGQQLQAGATLGECFAAAGTTRRHGYKILARPLRKPGR